MKKHILEVPGLIPRTGLSPCEGKTIVVPSVVKERSALNSMLASKVTFARAFISNVGPMVRILKQSEFKKQGCNPEKTYPGKSRAGMPTSNKVMVGDSKVPCVKY